MAKEEKREASVWACCSLSSHTSTCSHSSVLMQLHSSVLSAEGHERMAPRCSARMQPDVTVKHKASRQTPKCISYSPPPLLFYLVLVSAFTLSENCKQGEEEEKAETSGSPIEKEGDPGLLQGSLVRGCFLPR